MMHLSLMLGRAVARSHIDELSRRVHRDRLGPRRPRRKTRTPSGGSPPDLS